MRETRLTAGVRNPAACGGFSVTAIREGRSVEALPNLQEALKPTGKLNAHARNEAHADLRLVMAEVKRIIRSINTMNQLLATKQWKYEQREGQDIAYKKVGNWHE